MNAEQQQAELAIIDQASQWYVRHRDGPVGPAESEAFLQWLLASPAHVQEYLNVAETASHLPQAVAGMRVDRQELVAQARHWLRTTANVVELPRAQLAAQSRASVKRKTFRSAAGIAAVLALAAIGAGMYTKSGSLELQVPRGEQRTVQLEDGSVLHLNADTRVRVRYSSSQRLIDLEYGQALFSVVADRERPFVVRSAGTEVVAIGTQFEVMLRGQGSALIVTVMEGEVDVRSSATAASPPGPGLLPGPVRLSAGQRLELDEAATAPPRPRTVDVHAATAWLRRELVFSEQPLAEVAAEFSRYGPLIEIADPDLREYRVSGVFNAYDTESFLIFLRRIGRIERTGEGVRVHGPEH